MMRVSSSAALATAFLLASASITLAERVTVYELKAGAVCRDADLMVVEPRHCPKQRPFDADRDVAKGVVSTVIDNASCYFDLTEVILDQSAAKIIPRHGPQQTDTMQMAMRGLTLSNDNGCTR